MIEDGLILAGSDAADKIRLHDIQSANCDVVDLKRVVTKSFEDVFSCFAQ